MVKILLMSISYLYFFFANFTSGYSSYLLIINTLYINKINFSHMLQK